MPLRQIKSRLKAVGRRVQAAVVHVSLIALYLFGLGVTRLWVAVFRRGLLSSPASAGESFWLDAADHGFDEVGSLRQS